MNTFRERRYLTTILITAIVILALGVASFVFSIVEILKTQQYEAIFELVYLGIHLIMAVVYIIVTYKALKKGESFVMRSLMVDDQGERGTPSSVLTMVFASVFFILAVYFALMFFGAVPTIFNFNKVLILCIVNGSLLVSSLGLFFFLYPTIIGKKVI